MEWIQVQPRMALKDEGSSITIKGTRAVTGPTITSNTTSPSKVVCVSLKPTKVLLKLRRLSGWYPSRSNARGGGG